jgi:hypothetical protein
MLLVLFRIHAVAAGLVFLAMAVNAASRRDKRVWFWIAAASAYGCVVAITFAHLTGVIIGAVILATSVVVHRVVQRAASVSSGYPRVLRERPASNRTGPGKASPVSTASRRAAKARSKAERFSNTG